MNTTRNHRWLLIATVLVAVAAAPAWALTRKEQKVLRKTFFSEVKTIAAAPLKVSGAADREAVEEKFHGVIERRFEPHDIKILESSVYGDFWMEKARELGGIYDANTGRLIRENRDVVEQYARDNTERLHDVDMYMFTEIEPVKAEYSNSVAIWDDVKEKIYRPKSGGVSAGVTGTITGLSLTVRFVDQDGNEVYSGRGGIQLAEKFGKGGREAILPEKLFTFDDRNSMAVHIALRPLLLEWSDFVVDRRARRSKKARP